MWDAFDYGFGYLQNGTAVSLWATVLSTKSLVLDTMPSLRSLLLSAQGVLAISGLTSPVLRSTALTGASEVCSNPQLSCHNTTVVENLCCFNAPGGSLLQTQFWDTDPSTGPEDSWTIHGLWVCNEPVLHPTLASRTY